MGAARGPSAHLSWRELACRDGTPYPEAWRDTRAVGLAALFEALRSHGGHRPLVVGSGYRTTMHNLAIGGSRQSQHMQGRALDVYTPRGLSHETFHRRVRAFCRELATVGAVGYYRWGVHVDIRPRRRGRIVAWSRVRQGTPMRDTA